MKKIVWAAAAVLFLAGAALLAYPYLQKWKLQYENSREILQFQRNAAGEEADGAREGGAEKAPEPQEKTEGRGDAEEETGEENAAGYGEAEERERRALREEMQEYNKRIFEEKQRSLRDAWSYEQNVLDQEFASAGIKDDMAGYLTIDAMGIELPLYIGATQEHMRNGAVVLGQTSMPIGGSSTNCVIAAHRGTVRGDAMFRDIEKLKPGDEIKVSNFWETLTYRVEKCIAIYPDEIEKVKIVEGMDLVTLITCHPYGDNYQRYVVYCARAGTAETAGNGEKESGGAEGAESGDQAAASGIPYEGVPYESSAEEIRREDAAAKAGLWLAGIFAAAGIGYGIWSLLRAGAHRKKEKRK